MTKRWIVCPGFVESRHDLQTHWINAEKLIRLYGVNPEECIILLRDEMQIPLGYPLGYENLPVLRPRYDGDYRIHDDRAG